MCLAIPGKVIELVADGDVKMAKVQFGGIVKMACVEHVPQAKIGDYVLVHVGYALSVIDEKEARFVFDFLEQMGQLEELNEPAA